MNSDVVESELDECLLFEYFFTRKVMLIKYADARVCFPSGFGATDELTEVLTLIQTRKGRRIKIFLLGLSFWSPIINWFKTLKQQGYISQQDLNSVCLVDEIAQILTSIKEA